MEYMCQFRTVVEDADDCFRLSRPNRDGNDASLMWAAIAVAKVERRNAAHHAYPHVPLMVRPGRKGGVPDALFSCPCTGIEYMHACTGFVCAKNAANGPVQGTNEATRVNKQSLESVA